MSVLRPNICEAADMESFSGSFDVGPPNDLPPNDTPERCSLCANALPVWWYVVEPATNDECQLVGSVALARWWPVCADCDRLIASGAVKEVQKRHAEVAEVAVAEVVGEFLLLGERWGRITS
jgi:hypothetical protein